ncbi:MAG: hypothetical protein J0H74_22190 [Chitinophagaceae bacterium]|nr:hypothetical protein [Chitinophagaceae bacterium]
MSICYRLPAQTVTFDASGKLKQISAPNNRLIDFDINSLDNTNKEIKKKARGVLVQKIDESIKILRSNTYKQSIHQLFMVLWGNDMTRILNYLTSVREALIKQDIRLLSGTLAHAIAGPIRDNLLDLPSVFQTDFDTHQLTQISLKKTNPFNSFVVDYYNNTIDLIPPGLTLEIKLKETDYLLSHLSRVSALLKEGRKLGKFDGGYFSRISSFGQNPDVELLNIIKRLNNDWFKEWFWFRGGVITLNPLDFTTAEFIAGHPDHDLVKAGLFNEYIDTILSRQLRYDTVGRYKDFIEKIKLKGGGADLFSFRDKNDSLEELNKEKRDALLITKKVLNKVVIPASGDFFNYSAVTDITYKNDKEDLKKALHTNEKKVIALHNIIQGRTAGLVETNKASDDNSAFQQGFDTVASQLGSLAAIVAKFSPYASVLDFFSPPVTYLRSTIPFNLAVPQPEGVARVRMTTLDLGPDLLTMTYNPSDATMFKDRLIQLLPAAYLDRDLLNRIFPDEEDIPLRDITTPAQKNALQEKFQRYLTELMTSQINSLQSDSLLITQLIQVYNQSTLPETDKLEPATDDTPLYYTKLLETQTSDDAVEKSVVIYTQKNKDTTQVAKFSYKIGKNYPFKLGAGVAYTLNSYDQSTVRQENGQLSIVNNVRQYRLIVGAHFYFCKGLFNQDNSPWKWAERNSFFVGVGIPDPLGNLYFAFSHDIVPGLKISLGAHVAKSNRYFIQNNTIIEEKLRYKVAGPFVAITLDPTSVLNVLNIFKKQ